MKITFIAIFISLLSSGTAFSKLIRFGDFNWGSSLVEVEVQAAAENYNLLEKHISVPQTLLKYKSFHLGKDCTITFFFTPRGQKLYSVVVVWKPPSFGHFVREQLMKRYRTPREEIPGANLYIWTRLNTEVELRYGRDCTTLSYSNLHLWNDYRDEKKRLEEEAEEREDD